MIAGIFTILLGGLCFVLNKKFGRWLKRFSLAAFGAKEKVEVDEIIFRGLVCVGGLLYTGVGLMLFIQSLR